MAPVDCAVAQLPVDVVFCPHPGRCDVVRLLLAQGATVADALHTSGLLASHGLDASAVQAGVWSRVRDPATMLRAGDRVEIYRVLQVDPKEARRQRYKKHRNAASTPV